MANTSLQQTENIVLQEIERSKKFHGESDWYGNYFNNFYLRFHPIERESLSQLRSWDTPLEQRSQTMFSECSQLKRSQSWHQYYETLDAVVKEAGVSLDEVKRLSQQIAGNPDEKECRMLYKKLCDTILPAYILLRALGYSQQDLTGWSCCLQEH